ILVFSIVLIFSIIVTFFGIFLYDPRYSLHSFTQNNLLYGVLIGCFFGLIIMILEYNSWKTKKKMLVLELENKYLEELTEKDEILQEASKNLYITEERNRMARELHDSISQGIHGIIYSTKSLQQHLKQDKIDIAKLQIITEHLEATAEVTLGELRSMIMELKPALLEDKGLYRALVLLLDLFAKRQNIIVNQDIEEIEGLTPEQEVAIYRIVQEALTNIQKHSSANHVSVSLKKSDTEGIILSIQDNGKGFDLNENKEGNGLKNMKTRSKNNGGELIIDSHPENGTLIEVVF
ncbi:MAG: sensor histidine kinase, partial [Halanaerobiales bacterium]